MFQKKIFNVHCDVKDEYRMMMILYYAVVVSQVNGVYDIVLKANSDTIDKIKEAIISHKKTQHNQVNAHINSNRIELSSKDMSL